MAALSQGDNEWLRRYCRIIVRPPAIDAWAASGTGSRVSSDLQYSITAGYKWVGAVYKTAVSFQTKNSGWGFV